LQQELWSLNDTTILTNYIQIMQDKLNAQKNELSNINDEINKLMPNDDIIV
jgi:hypothetical protein